MASVAPHLHLEMMAELAACAGDFDVIHSHLDLLALPFTRLIDTPTVLTLHGRLDLDFVRELLPRYGSVPLVSISDDQRRAVADLDLTWAATVYNGLDLDHYRDVPHDSDGYLGFVGRIAHEKGPLTAIEVSRRTGVPLRLAAKVDPTDVAYYQEEVAPQMGSHVRFVGEITEDEKPTFYACARATLFPSDWPEPFGLVMIESLAAGTPVIALRRGSVPEIIEDGVTGFICDDVDEMVDAVGRIDEIDPEACRRGAARFSAERMCQGYVDVYRSLLSSSTGEPRSRRPGRPWGSRCPRAPARTEAGDCCGAVRHSTEKPGGSPSRPVAARRSAVARPSVTASCATRSSACAAGTGGGSDARPRAAARSAVCTTSSKVRVGR